MTELFFQTQGGSNFGSGLVSKLGNTTNGLNYPYKGSRERENFLKLPLLQQTTTTFGSNMYNPAAAMSGFVQTAGKLNTTMQAPRIENQKPTQRTVYFPKQP